MTLLTHARLLEVVRYEPGTGNFVALIQRGSRSKIGDILGTINVHGYVAFGIDGKTYTAHRLALYYVNGVWPEYMVDHIDGDRANNRWNNLREADMALNQQNRRRASRNSRSRLLGAWRHMGGKWQSQICAQGKRYSLGLFDTAEEAHAAYVAAKRSLHLGGCL